MKKKILFLGIGNAQYDAIGYLKSQGHEIVAVADSRNGHASGVVDGFHEIDIKDVEALCKLAVDEGFDHICSIGSDIAALSAAEVSEGIGLAAPVPFSAIALLHDKLNFRRFLLDNRLPCPRFDSADEGGPFKWDGFPSIVKPADSQGQRGVSVVKDAAGLENAVRMARSFSRAGRVIIEEYVDGNEVSALLFFEGGKAIFSAVIDREIVKPFAGGVVAKHRYPSLLPRPIQKAILDLSVTIVKKTGVLDGPFYLQMISTSNGPVPVELAARLDGCHLWRLIKMSSGADLLAAYFHFIFGSRNVVAEVLQSEVTKSLEQRFFHQKPGEVVKNGPALKEGALFLDFYYENGKIVPAINGVMEKTGYAIYPAAKAGL